MAAAFNQGLIESMEIRAHKSGSLPPNERKDAFPTRANTVHQNLFKKRKTILTNIGKCHFINLLIFQE